MGNVLISVLMAVSIGIYFLTKKNGKKEEEEAVEKVQIDMAMMQGNCEEGGNANKPYAIYQKDKM